MRFFTPSSPTPSDASQGSQPSQGPSSPIPAFVRMVSLPTPAWRSRANTNTQADEEALDGVTDDDIVKWCCYRDDEFMDVDEDDD